MQPEQAPPPVINLRPPGGKNPGTKAPATMSAPPGRATYTPFIAAGAIGGAMAMLLALGVLLICLMMLGNSDSSPKAEAAPKSAPDPHAVLPVVEMEPTPREANELNPATAPAEATPNLPTTVIGPAATASAEPAKIELPQTSSTETDEAILASNAPSSGAEPPPESSGEPGGELPASLSLPVLPDSSELPAADAMAPVLIGPLQTRDSMPLEIELLGGESAVRGSRQKFTLRPVVGSPHEWQILLSSNAGPLSVAQLNANDGKLEFRWTAEALKQPAIARQLANCALSVGTRPGIVALRKAAQGPPLGVDIEKTGIAIKWHVANLPIAKQTFLEIPRMEGVEVVRQEPAGAIAVGDSVILGVGPGDKSRCLLLKISTSSSPSTVDVRLQSLVKLEGSPEARPYRRKDLIALQPQFERKLEHCAEELKKVKRQSANTIPEKVIKDATIERLEADVLSLVTLSDQCRYILDFMARSGEAKIHFRLYHQAGEAQIDLLKTYVEPPAEREN